MNTKGRYCDDYGLSHLVSHLIRLRDREHILKLLSTFEYLEAKNERFTIYSLIEDFLEVEGSKLTSDLIQAVYQLIDRNAHTFSEGYSRIIPNFFLQHLRNIAFQTNNKDISNHIERLLEQRNAFWIKQTTPYNPLPAQNHRVINCHDGVIYAVAISPGGELVVSAGYDHQICVSNINTGKTVLRLTGHTEPIEDIAFSPDGHTIASASWDKTIKLWKAQTGQEERTLEGHQDHVRSVCFSPDGKWLASGSADGTVRLWCPTKHENDSILFASGETIRSVRFSPDQKWLAFADYKGQIHLWDFSQKKAVWQIQAHLNMAWELSFDPSSQRLASASPDRCVHIWDIRSGEEIQSIKGFSNFVSSANFSPDGRYLATTMIDGSESMLRLWDAKTFEEVTSFEGHTMAIWRTAFSQDGTTMASCSSDRTIRVWSLPQIIKGRSEIPGHSRRIAYLKVSADGYRMVSSDVGGDVWTWDILSGQILSKLPLPKRSSFQAAISGDGRVVATYREKESLVLWSADTGKRILSLDSPEGNIHTLALSRRGEYIACQGEKDLWVIMRQSSISANQHRLPVKSSTTLVFNQNNDLLASSSTSGEIEVWDWKQDKLVIKLIVGEKKEIRALAFSPDRKFLASGAEDNNVRVWNLASGEMKVLSGHKRWIRSICYSSDSRWLVSGSWDNCILAWDMNDNQPKAAYFTQDAVAGITFSRETYDLIAVDLARHPNIYKLKIITPG